MITVAILINGQPVYARSATKIKGDTGKCEYRVDNGQIVKHVYAEGAIVLAKKLLDTIKEEKE